MLAGKLHTLSDMNEGSSHYNCANNTQFTRIDVRLNEFRQTWNEQCTQTRDASHYVSHTYTHGRVMRYNTVCIV